MTPRLKNISNLRQRQRGSALISALVAAAVLMILMTALMSTRLSELRAINTTVAASRAQMLAEAGVNYVLGSIVSNQGVLPDSLPWDYGVIQLTDGGFQPTLDQDSDRRLIIKSIGIDASGTRRAVESMVQLTESNPLLDFALLSCGNVDLSGSGSTVKDGDVYAAGNLSIAASRGINGGDGMAKGNIELSGSGTVEGNIISKTGNIVAGGGAGLRVTGYAANPNGNATLSLAQAGSITRDASVWNIPDYCDSPWFDKYHITDDDFDTFKADAQADSNHFGDAALSTAGVGSYMGQRYISGNMTLSGTPSGYTLSGVYYVAGNLTVTGKFKGNATFIVEGDITFSGSPAATSADEQNHAFITKGNVILSGTPTVDGIVYAKGNISGTGNATINGSVITQGNANFGGNYDLNYRRVELPFVKEELSDLSILRWRSVSP